MGRLKNFLGSIFIGSGMKPKGDYPLMEAHDIVVDENGTRLDDKLEALASNTGGSGSVELDATLTQEGYAADAKAVGDILGDIHSILKRI